MDVIVGAIYDVLTTFGLPAATAQTVAEALGEFGSFFADFFRLLGDLFA